MTRIAIFADSHHKTNVLESAINYSVKKDADFFIHAGDIVEYDALKLFKKGNIPYFAVIGNNDYMLKKYQKGFNLFDEPFDGEFKGLKYRIMHYPFYFQDGFNIVVYGHTHYFSATRYVNSLYINPGEICGRKKQLFEFAIVDFDDEEFRVFKVESQINKINWKEREILL